MQFTLSSRYVPSHEVVSFQKVLCMLLQIKFQASQNQICVLYWTWILILIIKPTRCTNFLIFYLGMKLYMFQTFPIGIISSFSPYTQQWYMSSRFVDSSRAGSGWNYSSILILIENCLQTCTTYTTAVCRNCPKHVEFHSKIKFEKTIASSWFYYKDLSRWTVTWTWTERNGFWCSLLFFISQQ